MKTWMVIIGLMGCSLCFGAGKSITKDAGPFRVVFNLVEKMDRLSNYQICVYGAGKAVTLQTEWWAENDRRSVSSLARLTGMKDGYLFIPRSCGGGNAWACDQEWVIAFDRGPKVLGAVGRHVGAKRPGESLQNGLFRDGFNGLEINPYTCHAAAPSFEIFLELKKGRFVVEKEATWRRNAIPGGYKRKMSRSAWDNERKEEAVSAFIGDLALIRLCDRKNEWGLALSEGEKVFGSIRANEVADYVAKAVSKYKPGKAMQ
jgi:hypothetical protein